MSIKKLIEEIDGLETHIHKLKSAKNNTETTLETNYDLKVKLLNVDGGNKTQELNAFNGKYSSNGSTQLEILKVIIQHHIAILNSCKEKLSKALEPTTVN